MATWPVSGSTSTSTTCVPFGAKVGIGGVVALPGTLGAREHREVAARHELHDGGIRAVGAAGLDIGGVSDAAQLFSPFGLRKPLGESLAVRDLLRARQMR